ncbi:MAG: S-methyl-5-thioribose-1-phosphate isomerase [Candidatus Latescibacterota bacterium]|nr:MAG: S-methyl-5-thioribose-1-phosphate isomerase [Candidatus Latescibacterota bacterium]
MKILPTIALKKGAVELIDQTLLPVEYKILRLNRVEDLCEAIKALRIRGAPALGVAGAYGLLLAVEEKWRQHDTWYFDADGTNLDAFPAIATVEAVQQYIDINAKILRDTRPTAVNLGWAIDRMRKIYARVWDDPKAMLQALYNEAQAIYNEDIEMSLAMGRHGAALLNDGDNVITHCNTGGLATSGYGTAVAVVFSAVETGKRVHLYADETRPLLQGARLNTWECVDRGIPVTVLCDGASASLMSEKKIACAIVGADRIAANGDTANKIGTYNLAIVAKRFGVPFYVAAPSSTIDTAIATGSDIPIEQRSPDEVKQYRGVIVAPEEAEAYNPAFDVTPHELIAGWITEKGVLQPPFDR